MTKQKFISSFYDYFRKDIICAFDDVAKYCEKHVLTPEEKAQYEVAKNLALRPDIFRNVCFLASFISLVLNHHGDVIDLLGNNVKCSPLLLANLLTFDYLKNECK